jgi:hypothetical protein
MRLSFLNSSLSVIYLALSDFLRLCVFVLWASSGFLFTYFNSILPMSIQDQAWGVRGRKGGKRRNRAFSTEVFLSLKI